MTPEEIYQQYGEALVFMGAGGPIEDWGRGVAQILVDEGVTKEKNPYSVWKQAVDVNQVGERTDLILHFNPESVDIPKLSMWRMRARESFDVMWLSDYVNNPQIRGVSA